MTVREVFGTESNSRFEAILVDEANTKRTLFCATERQISSIVGITTNRKDQISQMEVIEMTHRQILHALRHCNSQASLKGVKGLISEALKAKGFQVGLANPNQPRQEIARPRIAEKMLEDFRILLDLYRHPVICYIGIEKIDDTNFKQSPKRWSPVVNAYDECMLVDWFDKIVLGARTLGSPMERYLQQYIKDRGRPPASGENVTAMLAWSGLTSEARENDTVRTVRQLEEDIVTAIAQARPLQEFCKAAGGAGIFCLLEEGFTERCVVFSLLWTCEETDVVCRIRATSLGLRQDYVAAVLTRADDFRVYVKMLTEHLLPNVLSRSDKAMETLRRLSFVEERGKEFPVLVSQLHSS